MTFQVFRRKLRNFTFQKAYRRPRYRLWSTHSILLLVRPANAPVDPFPSKPCIGELRFVTEEDLPDCAAFEDPAHYVPVYREMLRRGDLVLFGYLDGTCVFRCCLQCGGPILYQGYTERELAANEAYVHYVFCAPAARRKGFHKAALRYLRAACPGRVLYAQVMEDNIPSLRGFFRTGFRPYSRLTVKNRLFRSVLTEIPLAEEEVEALMALARPRKDPGNPPVKGG